MGQEIDATKITSVTLEGACPDCVGQEQVWVKARRDESGKHTCTTINVAGVPYVTKDGRTMYHSA